MWSVRLPKPISSHQSWISSVCVWACVWRVRGCRCAFRSAPDAASLPKPLLDFSNHLKSLGFQAKPDYAYLESCLDGAVGGGAPSQHVYEFQPARAAAAADATGLGTSQGGGEPSDHLDRGACVVTPSSPSSPPPPPPLSSLLRARARERERIVEPVSVLSRRILYSTHFSFKNRGLPHGRYTQPRHVWHWLRSALYL
jgi:hypothetical protein